MNTLHTTPHFTTSPPPLTPHPPTSNLNSWCDAFHWLWGYSISDIVCVRLRKTVFFSRQNIRILPRGNLADTLLPRLLVLGHDPALSEDNRRYTSQIHIAKIPSGRETCYFDQWSLINSIVWNSLWYLVLYLPSSYIRNLILPHH